MLGERRVLRVSSTRHALCRHGLPGVSSGPRFPGTMVRSGSRSAEPVPRAGETTVPASILDGKALARALQEKTALEVTRLRDHTETVPGLTVVLVGDDPASQVYVRNKQNACKAAGMNGDVLRLPADDQPGRAARDDRPAQRRPGRPRHPRPAAAAAGRSTTGRVIERIDPLKDVDGFHPVNVGPAGAWARPGSCRARRWGSASC